MAIPKKLRTLYARIPDAVGCQKCGGCCGALVPALKAENDAAWQYAKAHNFSPNPQERNCIFLHPDSKQCQVYAVRPFLCRIFGILTYPWLRGRLGRSPKQ